MKIKGKYKNLIFYEQETGLSLFSVETFDMSVPKNSYNEVICYGVIPNLPKGWSICVTGEFKDDIKVDSIYESDPFYGDTIRAANRESKFIVSDMQTDYSLSFVKSELTKYRDIGENTATKIFNTRVFENMHDREAFISTVMDITAQGKSTLDTMYQKFVFPDYVMSAYKKLSKYSISIYDIERIWDMYGLNGIKMLYREPYMVAMKSHISFLAADRIAADNGEKVYSRRRISALANETLRRLFDEGHTYVTLGMCMDEFKKIPSALSSEISDRFISSDFFHIKGIEVIVKNNEVMLFHKKRKLLEQNIARQIKRLADTSVNLKFKPSIIDEIAEETKMKYAAQQRGAFNLLHSTGLKIVTGGPGTGKTTTINGILRAYEKICPGKIVKCCAPTGRAAQRMSESTGREAVTVHRITEYQSFGDSNITCKNADNPIIADCLVVDEVSMLDVELASVLLSAIKDGTLVIFMGDINQLVSVGPGNVLKDIINSGVVEVYQLTDVFRQAADSGIITNAVKINKGNTKLAETDDFHILRFDDALSMKEACMDLFKKLWNLNDKFRVQFLSPAHKGCCGVRELNIAAQTYVNQNSNSYFSSGKRKFYPNDKIILTNNNYNMGYYNGDCGTVTSFTKGVGIEVDICGNMYSLDRGMMKDVSLAYDITIHKSQGSEYPIVIIPMSKNVPKMLVRNLLYTGVTRAKKEVYILSEQDAMEIAILTESVDSRKTTLKEQLIKIFS